MSKAEAKSLFYRRIMDIRRNPSDSFTKIAGQRAILATSLLAAGIIIVVAIHVYIVEWKYSGSIASEAFFIRCVETLQNCPDRLLFAALEQDAQNLRADRFRSALMTRLLAHTIAEIIALVLVVLGAVLVFDRIESNKMQGGSVTADHKRAWHGFTSASFNSTFPGVLLCLFGSFVIVVSLWIISSPNSRLTIFDLPVFLSDTNSVRNHTYVDGRIWLRSGMIPGEATTPSDEAGPADGENPLPRMSNEALRSLFE